jgi:hypothetical protein
MSAWSLEKSEDLKKIFAATHQDTTLTNMVVGFLIEKKETLIERADLGFASGVIYSSVEFFGLPRNTTSASFRSILEAIDPDLDADKILNYANIFNPLCIIEGPNAGQLQQHKNAKCMWFRPTERFIAWGQGKWNTGDAAIDALEVYKSNMGEGIDGEENPGKMTLNTRTPSFQALLQVAELLGLSIFQLERILQNSLSQYVDEKMCRGKITGVRIERSIFPGGNKGRAAALPQPIPLLRAQIRLSLEDPEAAAYMDRNFPTPILRIGNIECF